MHAIESWVRECNYVNETDFSDDQRRRGPKFRYI
jgi:hypothetical protein